MTDQHLLRRRFLGMLGTTATAGFAGCSTGDDTGTDGSNTPESSSPKSTTASTERSTTPQSTATDETTGDQEEPDYEVAAQQEFSDRGLMWLEVENMDNWDMEQEVGEDLNFRDYDRSTAATYDRFVEAVNDMYATEAEIGTVLIGFSDLVSDGSKENGPFRTVEVDYDWESTSNGETATAVHNYPVSEDAITQFLIENVHGVADHSEDIDSELLEYARQ